METRKIDEDSLVDLTFHLKWKSEAATHTDVFQANRVNIWRDFFPPHFQETLLGRQAGERIEAPLKSEDLVPKYDDHQLFHVKRRQFGHPPAKGKTRKPEVGRFYPKGLLRGLTGVFTTNVKPFRCVELDNDQMTVDFNHPLAGKELALSTVIGNVDTKRP